MVIIWKESQLTLYRLYYLAPPPLEGVHLFLGYSRKDSRVVMDGRKEVEVPRWSSSFRKPVFYILIFEVSDNIPETDEEEEVEVVATVQQAVSYFTSNNNKVRENM